MQEIFNTFDSLSDVCRYYNFPINGSGLRKAKKIITENSIDITHFTNGSKRKQKYIREKKKCPVCNSEFMTVINRKDEKITCSHSCANSYFRSGNNNPNWKDERYRTTCFLVHKKECIVCGENKIVTVHHFDENRKNNSPENLIPLCPTHHQYVHSRYKNEVIDKIIDFRDNFIKKQKNI